MPLTKEVKAELIAKYGASATDTGKSEVQIALLTQRINDITGHLKANVKDHHARRGLMMLVGKPGMRGSSNRPSIRRTGFSRRSGPRSMR